MSAGVGFIFFLGELDLLYLIIFKLVELLVAETLNYSTDCLVFPKVRFSLRMAVFVVAAH